MQRGVTLIEMAIVLVIVSFLVGVSLPGMQAWIDRLAVIRAEEETVGFYTKARLFALYRSGRIRVLFTGDSLVANIEGSEDSLVAWAPGPNLRGVHLQASRSVIRLYANGFGLGAANTKLIFRRGNAADSLTISRLGRLRRWP